MAHHHHHGHDHPHHGGMAEAEAHCAAHGHKLTDQRRQVLEALIDAPGAMGAYDIIDALAARGQKRLAPISVYRALDFLLEAGLAHKLASRNAFVACPHRHDSAEVVVFMICDACGRVQESTSEAVSIALSTVAQQLHFKPKGQVIEMAGQCDRCSAEGTVMTA